MEQAYILPIQCCQYHACWCAGDLRSQGISRHGIDQISRNILSLASKELRNGKCKYDLFPHNNSTHAWRVNLKKISMRRVEFCQLTSMRSWDMAFFALFFFGVFFFVVTGVKGSSSTFISSLLSSSPDAVNKKGKSFGKQSHRMKFILWLGSSRPWYSA